jgi:ASC-1-like (ASCH) protein
MELETDDIELDEDDVIEFNGERIQVKSLQKLDNATRMLAEIKSVDDAMHLIDLAEAARVYAKQVKLGLEAQNHATEIKIRAQRRAGEILLEMEKATGGEQYHSTGWSLQPVVQTYSSIGIEKHDAHTWQTIAKVPEDDFRNFIERVKTEEKELSTAAAYREAKRVLRGDEVTIDVPDTITQTVANIYFAQICNAIEQNDSKWLLSEDCRFLFETLHLPYLSIGVWAKNGCEPKMTPTSEVHISFLKFKYDQSRFAFEAMGGDYA